MPLQTCIFPETVFIFHELISVQSCSQYCFSARQLKIADIFMFSAENFYCIALEVTVGPTNISGADVFHLTTKPEEALLRIPLKLVFALVI